MSDDSNLISQIKKLHLLQGTVYAMGAALFTAALFAKNAFLAFVGAGLMLFAVAVNMLIDYIRGSHKEWAECLVLVGQIILAFVLASLAFGLARCQYTHQWR